MSTIEDAARLWQDCHREATAILNGEPTIELARPAFTARQRQVEALGDEAIRIAGQPIPIATLRSAILAAESPADLADRMAVLLGDLSQDQFAIALEQALFAAAVIGYVHSIDRA